MGKASVETKTCNRDLVFKVGWGLRLMAGGGRMEFARRPARDGPNCDDAAAPAAKQRREGGAAGLGETGLPRNNV